MCGISGIISKVPLREHANDVTAMTSALVHRGPDQSYMGSSLDGRAHFGVRRLRIVDMDGSDQPITTSDRELKLIFNGEIYNHTEIRNSLKKQNIHWQTEGDGEVLLHLYRLYGLDFVDHLRGMFAFALFDESKKRVIVGRDRMGEKPLYFTHRDGEIAFSSELHSLCHCSFVSNKIDEAAINSYFHFNYIPEPLTPLRDVKKFPPAHILVIDLNNWTKSLHRYWSMLDNDSHEGVGVPADAEAVSKIIRTKAHESIQMCVRADTPVAVSLSGGIDSSAVASLCKQYKPDTMAISVGFKQDAKSKQTFDERHEAKQLANHLGLTFHDIEVDSVDMLENFQNHVSACDDPVADISGYAYSQAARKSNEIGCPVLLFGHGGDELFMGYNWLKQGVEDELCYQNNHRSAHLPGANQTPITGYDALLGYMETGNKPRTVPSLQLALDFVDAEKNLHGFTSSTFKENLRNRGYVADPYWPTYCSNGSVTTHAIVSTIALENYMRSNNIVQADRLSMRHSVESRLPWLDHEFVGAMFKLMKHWPQTKPFDKSIWRCAMSSDLPEFVLRRKKAPFRPPVREWLHGISDRFGGHLINGKLQEFEILTEQAVKTLSTRKSETAVSMPMFYRAIVLELWLRSLPSK